MLRRASSKGSWAFVAAALLSVGSGLPSLAHARREVPPELPRVALGALPAEAQMTYRLVFQGGPFPYSKDGIVFGNRERQLPIKARGRYREYTVKTPGARDRGARRIVCAGEPPAPPEACFYTDDHYASFRHIEP
jgi:ribonuclease T1